MAAYKRRVWTHDARVVDPAALSFALLVRLTGTADGAADVFRAHGARDGEHCRLRGTERRRGFAGHGRGKVGRCGRAEPV